MPDVNAPKPELKIEAAPPHMPAEQELAGLSTKEADERVREALPETQDEILHAESSSELEAAKASYAPPPGDDGAVRLGSAHESKDEVTIEVEKVLEEGMGPFFQSLPPEARPLFKQKGEEAALKIGDMLRTLKVNVKKISDLIVAWLKTIPGVNKYFLEQEAKIKTDKIMELVEARKQAQSKEV